MIIIKCNISTHGSEKSVNVAWVNVHDNVENVFIFNFSHHLPMRVLIHLSNVKVSFRHFH